MVLTTSWEQLMAAPGLRAGKAAYADTSSFPILLPFWEKPVEQEPWIMLWRKAWKQLAKTDELIIWGYSLPPTDVKTRHLFSLATSRPNRSSPLRLCVIDP